MSLMLTGYMPRHSAVKVASTSVPVHPLLAERWSPRGFDRTHELGDRDLTALLEAARWAPSSKNSQPWRFLVTRRGEEAHSRLFAALAPGNQIWAGTASALVLVAARTVGDDGSTAELPEYLAARDAAPRTRRPVSDLLLPARSRRELAAAA